MRETASGLAPPLRLVHARHGGGVLKWLLEQSDDSDPPEWAGRFRVRVGAGPSPWYGSAGIVAWIGLGFSTSRVREPAQPESDPVLQLHSLPVSFFRR